MVCKKCGDTGSTDGVFLDCSEVGCAAAETFANLTAWLRGQGFGDGGVKERAIYRYAVRKEVESAALLLAKNEELRVSIAQKKDLITALIGEKARAEKAVSDLAEKLSEQPVAAQRHVQAEQDRGAETADTEPKSYLSPLGKGGKGDAEELLSDKEIDLIMVTNGFPNTRPTAAFRSFARAILAASQQPAAAPTEYRNDPNVQGMADCMDMVRSELIETGIVDAKTAPMFIVESVCRFVAALNREILELKRVYKERGNQIERLEIAVERCDIAAAPTIQVQEGAVLDERAEFEVEECRHTTNLTRQDDGQYENPCTQRAWEGWQARAALAAPAPVQPAPVADAAQGDSLSQQMELPELNADLFDILGRPCFTCIKVAKRLREMGRVIPQRAENEQAETIYLFLSTYLKHGAKWRDEVEAYLKRGTTKPSEEA